MLKFSLVCSYLFIYLFCSFSGESFGNYLDPDSTVTDYDGNIYTTVVIGDQIWMKENLKSLRYSDGAPIQGVTAYENDAALAETYGLLYTWDAAMKNSTEPGNQGVCPCGWHLPTADEWNTAVNILGGASVAGGAMKTTGTEFWQSPNSGATNTSGLSVLPAGEYDAHSNPKKYQLLGQYAVYWTSTQVSSSKAREKYLSFDNESVSTYDWYKDLYYSIRCIKDKTTDIFELENTPKGYRLDQNYPNPFNPVTKISFVIPVSGNVKLQVYDLLGKEVFCSLYEFSAPGEYEIYFNGSNLAAGVYLYKLTAHDFIASRKMILLK